MPKVILALCITLVVSLLSMVIYSAVQQASLDSFGMVTQKKYTAQRYVREIKIGDVYMPSQFYPEKFFLILENGKRVNVHESTWSTVKVGQWWGDDER